jgi:hypothetical protein
MSTQVQYRRGTNAQNAAFTGALAEITVDTTNGTLRVHDGITAGGSNIATVGYVTSQISALSANSITNGTSSVAVIASGGNVRTNIAGATVQTISTGLVAITGDLSVTGNATLSGNILGDRIQNGTTTIDIQTPSGNANITVGATSNVAVFSTTGANISGILGVTGNITGGNLSGTSIVGTLTTAAQTNITSVGTLSALAVTGNTTSGNFVGTLNGSGANVTAISATNISAGTLAQARLANAAVTLGSTALTLGATVTTVAGLSSVTSTTFVGALTGAATTAGTVTTAAQPNITSVGTLSSLTVTGNVTGGNLITAGLVSLSSITKTGSNGVGNIGSSTSTFNTIFAKATSAQYADLAEMYVSDADYAPGTVVEFGGEYEITISSSSHSTAVAGIVSTNPSYLMNSTQAGEHVLPIALTGRVPCQVLGPVRKGDVLVASSIPGVAQRIGMNWQPGCVVGKSMEVIDTAEIQTIEVAVGRL